MCGYICFLISYFFLLLLFLSDILQVGVFELQSPGSVSVIDGTASG